MRQSSRKPFYVYAIIMVLLLGLFPADLGSVARADSDYRLQETFETYSTGAKPAGWTIKTPPQGVSVGVQAWEGYPGKLLELEQTSKLASSYSISKSVTDVTYRSMFSYSFRAEQTGAVIYLPTPQSGSVPLVKFAINNGAFSYMKKGAGSWTSVLPVSAGVWHEVRLSLDGGGHTFDLSIDGNRLLTKEPMAEGGALTSFYMGFYKDSTGKIGFDNFIVSGYKQAVSAAFTQQSYGLRRGEKLSLPLQFTPADATDQTAVWSSGDGEVATVDGNGLVTGIRQGTTVVTAQPNEELPAVTATVAVYEDPITDIVLAPLQRAVPAGSRVLLQATVTPEDNTDTGILWGTEDESIAVIDRYGELTGVSAGTTTVFVTDETGSVRAETDVTVTGRTTGQELYVAPGGDDNNNDGTEASPFRTIARAQAEVRQLNEDMDADIIVNLREGTYTLTEPLEFTPEDSGTNGYFVTYRSYPGEQAAISGGRSVTGWTVFDSAKGIYRANVGTGLQTRQLFVDGIRAVRARSTAGLVNPLKTATGYTSDNTELAGWSNTSDMELVFNELWTNSRIKVESVTASGGKAQIVLQEPGRSAVFNRGLTSATVPVYYENAMELLDEAGEWYYNRNEGMLYYKPRAWENLSTAGVVVPVLEQLATVYGRSAGEPVRNLNFEGLKFMYTTWNRPSTAAGHSDSQNNHLRYPSIPDELTDAAVMLELANTVNFRNNQFTKLGITALRMQNGVQNSLVEGNRFYDISGSALNVGQPNSTDRNIYHPADPRLLMKNNDVLNNVIHDIGIDYKSASAVSAGYPVDMDISHNEMYNLPYSGTHIGYGWDKLFDAATRNVKIQDNLIYDLMGMGLRDGGAIYSLGPTGATAEDKNLVSGNYIRNQMDGNSALYTDEGSAYWKFEHNVIDLKDTPLWHSPLRWAMAYVPTIHDVDFVNNYTTTDGYTNNGRNVLFADNTVQPDAEWPQAARSIIDRAGLEPEYASAAEGQVSRWKLDPLKLAAGGSGQVSVRAMNGKDQPLGKETSSFYYSILNPAVASVSSSGVVTGLAQGQTKLIVNIINGSILRTITTDVYVGDTLATVRLEGHDGNVAYIREGTGLQLQPYGETLFGNREELEEVTYTSSDPSIVSVSGTGLLTGHQTGSATLTLSAEYLGTVTQGQYEVKVWNEVSQYEHPLTAELQDPDGWYVSATANGLKETGQDSLTLRAPGGHIIYQNRKYQNELLDFKMKINDSAASSNWYALMLNNQSKELSYSTGSMYLVVIGTSGIELHRFNEGVRTVIYGKIDGLTSLDGPAIPNTAITFGVQSRVQLGAFQESGGVRLILKVNGVQIFNYLDTAAGAIGEAGYFGLVSRNASTELGY
ncbi:Ig-like domain-containing protein [Paenibacillus sp. FSL R7-0302]|uniref:Ig-like domain-containing protein n=1 Tax=Paenibacillus sp. FSL R7-0302 TaxID=2921681 RepID=UPI0030F91B96